jgi:NADH-quinone oxidoreductase subunit J
MTSPLEVVVVGLAILAGASALLAVTSPRISHCALWLLVSLLSLAGVYLTLGAEMVALVQLLVYVGAVVVVVIFALMMTRDPARPTRLLDAPPGQRLAGAVGGIGVAAVMAGTLTYALGDDSVSVQQTQGNPTAVGQAIFAGWLIPFELLSVLLLAALVAALAISKGGEERAQARRSERAGPE